MKIGLKIAYLNVINIQVPLGKILATNVLDQCLVDSKTILVGDLNGKKSHVGQWRVRRTWKVAGRFCRIARSDGNKYTTAHVY